MIREMQGAKAMKRAKSGNASEVNEMYAGPANHKAKKVLVPASVIMQRQQAEAGTKAFPKAGGTASSKMKPVDSARTFKKNACLKLIKKVLVN